MQRAKVADRKDVITSDETCDGPVAFLLNQGKRDRLVVERARVGEPYSLVIGPRRSSLLKLDTRGQLAVDPVPL
jgi:hypothetical protein